MTSYIIWVIYYESYILVEFQKISILRSKVELCDVTWSKRGKEYGEPKWPRDGGMTPDDLFGLFDLEWPLTCLILTFGDLQWALFTFFSIWNNSAISTALQNLWVMMTHQMMIYQWWLIILNSPRLAKNDVIVTSSPYLYYPSYLATTDFT